jgi:glycosyltransferase involved in cell wall biosynthesis
MATALAGCPLVREADFTLGFGTTIPAGGEGFPPHFIYTDHTIQANRYYPDAAAKLHAWDQVADDERQNVQNAAMVFTMSRHVSRSLAEHYGLDADRIRCVGAGCNIPVVYPPAPGRFTRQRILFVGVDWRRKGGPGLLKALALVRRHCPGATLTVVGCSPKLTDPGVRVVGSVPQVGVARHLAESTVFCMPSVREPFGIAYLEAMRAALPVVALRVGAAPDFVIDGVTGYTVAPGDIPGLAHRLERLLGDPGECRQIGRRGRLLVESWYTWPAVQRRMFESIQAMLAGAPQPVAANAGSS